MAYTSDEIHAWVLANVPPGAVVHVKGTAKKPAFRLVSQITRNAFGDESLIGGHLKYGYDRAEDEVIEYLGRDRDSLFETEHSLHNVSHIITALDPHMPQHERRWPVYRYAMVTIGKAIKDGIRVPVLADRFGGATPPVEQQATQPVPMQVPIPGQDPSHATLTAAFKTNDATRFLATALAHKDHGSLEMAEEALRQALAAVEAAQAIFTAKHDLDRG